MSELVMEALESNEKALRTMIVKQWKTQVELTWLFVALTMQGAMLATYAHSTLSAFLFGVAAVGWGLGALVALHNVRIWNALKRDYPLDDRTC